ncbi:MAG: hypothetical protein GF418_10880 [Chitinivibrionales bacterium]|nr:hypothetical protein [Chitinivibrionales bacterium]MBD3396119.1 hypothetical protein [Chitinivibrionales bacterium]
MSNVFIEKDGQLFAPPLACGLLPGVLRERLLKSGKCIEKVLTLRDVRGADAVYCGNSVWGLVRAHPAF